VDLAAGAAVAILFWVMAGLPQTEPADFFSLSLS
jgi:hypothetical protein